MEKGEALSPPACPSASKRVIPCLDQAHAQQGTPPSGVASRREVTSAWGHPDSDGKGDQWEAVMGHPVRWGGLLQAESCDQGVGSRSSMN